jgi:hypothetical protein
MALSPTWRNLKIDRVVGRCVHLDTFAAASSDAATVVIDSRDSLLAPDSSNQRDDEIGHVALGVEGGSLLGISILPLNPTPSSMTFTGVHPVRIGAYDRLSTPTPGPAARTSGPDGMYPPGVPARAGTSLSSPKGSTVSSAPQWSELVNVTVNLVAGDIIDISKPRQRYHDGALKPTT